MKSNEIFYAKILLFGEYSIIKNSMALTIPYTHFTGELSFIADEKYTDCDFAVNSNAELKKFARYLENLMNDTGCQVKIDVEAFRQDLRKGLYFESNIPQGYGIGSSGALCAAIYHRYGVDRINNGTDAKNEDILRLKMLFSRLESYFHGTSSGIDPLNSYFGHPLLIRSREKIEMVGIPRNPRDRNSAIFVINTGTTGHTEPLVRYFLERYEQEGFQELVNHQLIPLTNTCIESILAADHDRLFPHLKQLSALQLEHFDKMIPGQFRELWSGGLSSDDYYLKLCGSGGGGFILGFTRNYDQVKARISGAGHEVITVHRNTELPRFH